MCGGSVAPDIAEVILAGIVTATTEEATVLNRGPKGRDVFGRLWRFCDYPCCQRKGRESPHCSKNSQNPFQLEDSLLILPHLKRLVIVRSFTIGAFQARNSTRLNFYKSTVRISTFKDFFFSAGTQLNLARLAVQCLLINEMVD